MFIGKIIAFGFDLFVESLLLKEFPRKSAILADCTTIII